MLVLWTWLDGNKTAIGGALLVLSQFLEDVVIGKWQLTDVWIPRAIDLLNYGGYVFAGGGLAHKGVKLIVPAAPTAGASGIAATPPKQ